VSDATKKVVAKGPCEKCSLAICGVAQKKSINERIEKESKKPERQNNLK
jgi:hypothetical protein